MIVTNKEVRLSGLELMAKARESLKKMTLIDGFLFENVFLRDEDAKLASGILLSRILGKRIIVKEVRDERNIYGIGPGNHGIRMDAFVQAVDAENDPPDADAVAAVYDIEPDNNADERSTLPRRNRYYGSLVDARLLRSGESYALLPDFVSIFITSYDPFGAGDMIYEARSAFTSHPDLDYEDGIRRIYLYCDGRINADYPKEDGRRIQELLQYICHGKYSSSSAGTDIVRLDEIVQRIKRQEEVNLGYMKWYEEQYYLRKKAIKEGHEQGLEQGLEQGRAQGLEQGRAQGLEQGRAQGLEQGRAQGLEQGREEQALKDAAAYIQDIRENYHGTDEMILKSLVAKYGLAPETAEKLIRESPVVMG